MKQKTTTFSAPITVHTQLAKDVEVALGQNVHLCYQCVKCTSGCPLARYFDWQPNQIMRLIQLGQEEIVFSAQTPWLCASCQTCTTRCPQNLDIAGIMDYLVRESERRGYPSQLPEQDVFSEAFLREVRFWGRAYELGLMAEIKLRTRNLTGDLDLGWRMIRKGKLGFLPSPAFSPDPEKVKPIPDASTVVAYYPGCSLHSTAPEFDATTRAVCEALDIKLMVPPGWVCCGGSVAHRFAPQEAYSLPLRNLSLMEQYGFNEVVMPCAACYNRHKFAQFEFRHKHNEVSSSEREPLIPYEDQIMVETLHDILLHHAGLDKIKEKTKKDLSDLKAVCYYGCLLTRPSDITGAEHPENPTGLDQILSAIGVEVVDWSYKTSCCGASHSVVRTDIVHDLARDLIGHAREVGADLIAVACPLCHMNLDARQFQLGLETPMPVLYFTQLVHLAFDLPVKNACLHKNLVDPFPLLQSAGIL